MNRVLRAQRDITARFRRVSNLYIAYVNSDGSPEEWGREFSIAIGEVLEGRPIDQLELFHINKSEVENVVSYGKKEDSDESRTGIRRPYRRPELQQLRMQRG